MRTLLLLALCSFGLFCCSDKKKSSDPAAEAPASCQQNSDCGTSEVCLNGQCASTAPGAIYADPASAVTPDKVRSEVERINEQAAKRNDELLDGM